MKKLLFASILVFCFSIFAFPQANNSVCPEITVSGPDGLVKAGDSISFTTNVKNAVGTLKLEFEWEVSQGTIINGQGTNQILVETTPEMAGLNITATIKIKGLSENCKREASEIAVIEDVIIACVFPYGKISREEEFLQIDNLLVTLINMPEARGHIFFEIEKTEDLGEVKKRLTSVFNHIKNRNFNRDLIIYDICYAEDNQTTFRIIPEGASLPEVPNCEKVYIDLK